MDTKEEQNMVIRTVLKNKSGNYLYEYLNLREKQPSFTEDRQVEHVVYFTGLRHVKGDHILKANAKIAIETFEVTKFFSLPSLLRLDFIQARASTGLLL